jgi:hypothetical protein
MPAGLRWSVQRWLSNQAGNAVTFAGACSRLVGQDGSHLVDELAPGTGIAGQQIWRVADQLGMALPLLGMARGSGRRPTDDDDEGAERAAYQPIVTAQRDHFSRICTDARDAFQDVVDLVLIHNERPVSGRQPRTTLNRLIAMLSVAAWERFIADIGKLSRARQDKPFQGPGIAYGSGAYLGKCPRDSQIPTAVKVLGGASGGALPGSWQIRVPSSGSGKRLSFAPACRGLDSDLVEITDWWVTIRNGIAHRGLPQVPEWLIVTDAEQQAGRTINTTTARFAMTLFLQLVDQSIRALAESAKLEKPGELWLPSDWLSGQLRAARGVNAPAELLLWDGPSLTV